MWPMGLLLFNSSLAVGAIFSLKSSTARHNSDKLQILNLRDKVNRIGSKKQSDLATAKAFVGTCTDMYPEKERYDREEKRRLHTCNYEVLQGIEGEGCVVTYKITR
ncbi:germinal-center associated nuclear protein-like [Crassostrea virginica]